MMYSPEGSGRPPVSAPFPPAWIGDPGRVTIGTTFRTVLYLRASQDRSAPETVVEILFDPRMVYCVAVEPPPRGGPGCSTDVTMTPGAARIAVTLDREVGAGEYSGGIPVATVQWRCVGEGDTRIAVREAASSAPPSELRLSLQPR